MKGRSGGRGRARMLLQYPELLAKGRRSVPSRPHSHRQPLRSTCSEQSEWRGTG
jgi:hypothetical protein